jgi:protein SCO1/2
MIALAKRTFRRIAAAVAATAAVVCLAGAPRVALAGGAPPPLSAPDNNLPKQLENIGIDDHAGQDLPLDAKLTDQDGNAVRLGDYFDGKRPVLFAMAYYECPMLCSLVLKGALDSMKELKWTAGDDYRVVVVSFDPRDTPAKATAKRNNYIDAYGRKVAPRGWDFLVGDEATTRRIADAVGFHYRWDPQGEQYAHAAGAFVLTPQGRISRTLYGLSFPEIRLSLLEASEGKIGTVVEKFLLFCFHYDPAAKGYVLATLRLVKASGALTLLVLGAFLFRFWRAERRRRASGGGDLGADAFPAPGPGEPLPESRS